MKNRIAALTKAPALILIDVQEGFKDPVWGPRNNPNAELKIKSLLDFFRLEGYPVIHIQHVSTEPKSPLRPGQGGVEFMPFVKPQEQEYVFQKQVNSAFIGTSLEGFLKSKGIESLVMVGFTSDHCVSTSARMAANLGFNVFLPKEAIVTFERHGSHTSYPPELVHEISLASLNGEFATVLSVDDIIPPHEAPAFR